MDNLATLSQEINKWRSSKSFRTQPIPLDLLEKAQEAVKKHGFSVVNRMTKVTKEQLNRVNRPKGQEQKVTSSDAPLKWTVVEVPIPGKPSLELSFPGGISVTTSDTATAIELIRALGGEVRR